MKLLVRELFSISYSPSVSMVYLSHALSSVRASVNKRNPSAPAELVFWLGKFGGEEGNLYRA